MDMQLLADILEALADKVPLCKLLVEKRGYDILINTFIDDPQCDNKKDGDHSIGDNLADTPPFYVYVVSR